MPDNFTNNVVTTLRQGLLTTDTIMRVKVGDGAKFALPIGDYAYVTLRDKLNYEVVRYQIAGTVPILPLPNPPTSPGDDITIIRAQDNTIARQFPVGTCVTIEWNEAQFNDTVNQIAETHETQVLAVAPIVSTLDDTAVNKVYTVTINGSAFQVAVGVVDPVAPPAFGTPPLYVNTVSSDAFMWTGTAWLLLTPNLRTGTANPTLPPAIGESPFFLNTVTGLTFGWTSGNAWVQLTNPNTTPDLSPYATIVAMNLGDSTVANAASTNLANAVSTLNAAIAAAGTPQSVTGTAPIASSGGVNPNISHDASGVTPGTYDLVSVSALGHVLSGVVATPVASQIAGSSVTFSNGFIVKWGTSSLSNPSGVAGNPDTDTVVYPVAFPTAVLSTWISPRVENNLTNFKASLGTASQFVVDVNFGPGGTATMAWIAIGY